MIVSHLPDDLIDPPRGALMKSVLRVAVGTAKVAVSQSHKDAGFAGVTRFALDAVEDLIDNKLGHNDAESLRKGTKMRQEKQESG